MLLFSFAFKVKSVRFSLKKKMLSLEKHLSLLLCKCHVMTHYTGEDCSFQFEEEKMLSLKNASVYFEAQTRRVKTQQIPSQRGI